MASTIEEISISYSEDGIELVKELDKEVLSKGAWTTIIFRYQDWDRGKQTYGPEKFYYPQVSKEEWSVYA